MLPCFVVIVSNFVRSNQKNAKTMVVRFLWVPVVFDFVTNSYISFFTGTLSKYWFQSQALDSGGLVISSVGLWLSNLRRFSWVTGTKALIFMVRCKCKRV